MSNGCGDTLSLADLQTAKKHQLFEAEVITGKQGGTTAGVDIDYATNQVTGQSQKTLPAILRDAGFQPAPFDFTTGGTLGVNDRNKVVYDPVSKAWYSWSGALPHVVAAGTNPVGNINWVPQTDPNLRNDLASKGGVTLVANAQASANTIAELITLNLGINTTIILSGYYSSGDGAAHGRIISDTDNGTGVRLVNGLWANIPLESIEVDVSWLGAKRQQDYDSLPIFTKALSLFKSVKFHGHYYLSSGIKMDNGYNLRGDNVDSSVLEITTTGGETTGALVYDLPYASGQNISVKGSNVSDMTLLSNINQDNWNTDGSGMVHAGIYAGAGDGNSGGIALSTIKNIKIVGFGYVTDIKQGYLNSIDNIRGEKCYRGVSISGGTSYTIGLLSVAQVKNFCFAFDNMFYSYVSSLIADYCDVGHFLGTTNSDITIGTVGAEFITNVVNMYRLSGSKVTIGNSRYIAISGSQTGAFYYLEYGSYLNCLTENSLNDGWGIPSNNVTQSDLILGNMLNIRRLVYENSYQYTSYDLNSLLNFRGYGKLFQFSGGNMPGPGSWVIDYVSTTNDVGAPGKGSFQVGTSLTDGSIKRRRFDGAVWTTWA